MLRLVLLGMICISMAQGKELKVISYNAWHGLSTRYPTRSLESNPNRLNRYQWQIEELKKQDADLILMQEVYPLVKRSQELAKKLDMDVLVAADSCSLSSDGLVGQIVLAKKSLRLNLVGTIFLSGDENCSLQLNNSTRVAMFVEVDHPHLGKLLVVNTQLNTKMGLTISFYRDILNLAYDQTLNQRQLGRLVEQLRAPDLIREREIKTLTERIRQLKYAYRGVIMGGDLGADPSSSVLTPLFSIGLYDTYFGNHKKSPLQSTWAPDLNQTNFQLVKNDLSLPQLNLFNNSSLIKKFHHIYFKAFATQRRVDYLFTTSNLNRRLKSTKIALTNPISTTTQGSTHFAVISTF